MSSDLIAVRTHNVMIKSRDGSQSATKAVSKAIQFCLNNSRNRVYLSFVINIIAFFKSDALASSVGISFHSR